MKDTASTAAHNSTQTRFQRSEVTADNLLHKMYVDPDNQPYTRQSIQVELNNIIATIEPKNKNIEDMISHVRFSAATPVLAMAARMAAANALGLPQWQEAPIKEREALLQQATTNLTVAQVMDALNAVAQMKVNKTPASTAENAWQR